MRKGITTSAVLFLGAIVLLFFTAYVTWTFIYGGKHARPSSPESSPEGNQEGGCLKDDNCKFNSDGSKCLDITDPNFPERFAKFCGCYKNEHCKSTSEVKRSGVCGQNNKC